MLYGDQVDNFSNHFLHFSYCIFSAVPRPRELASQNAGEGAGGAGDGGGGGFNLDESHDDVDEVAGAGPVPAAAGLWAEGEEGADLVKELLENMETR